MRARSTAKVSSVSSIIQLPVEERFFSHWNTDPWQLDYGGDGRTLACGSVYLLPYYMGRYHGLIE